MLTCFVVHYFGSLNNCNKQFILVFSQNHSILLALFAIIVSVSPLLDYIDHRRNPDRYWCRYWAKCDIYVYFWLLLCSYQPFTDDWTRNRWSSSLATGALVSIGLVLRYACKKQDIWIELIYDPCALCCVYCGFVRYIPLGPKYLSARVMIHWCIRYSFVKYILLVYWSLGSDSYWNKPDIRYSSQANHRLSITR